MFTTARCEVLLDEHTPKGHEVSAGRAYRSGKRVAVLRRKGVTPQITDKAKRGKPLSQCQIAF